MKNLLREKMLRGEKTVGTFLFTNSASAVECLGLAGLDYVIIDGEHSAISAQDVLEFSRTAKLYGITPLARVTDLNRSSISLDSKVSSFPWIVFSTPGCFCHPRYLVPSY
jgi:4-hydroxy-2-oxoheptanedioate aldolase